MTAPGDVIDERFELRERLGSGGMGTVWRAWDTALHREVALKEVRPPDPAATTAEQAAVLRERVLREARALARLSHPHVVTIHHIVEGEGPPGHPWLVMELLPGDTLQDRIASGPIAPREAARIGRQVLSALRAAHTAGISHRDVKPANVLLRADGSAVLTDFGIAALQGSSSLTATGELIGSPEYIAPERIRGRDDAPASDLWSLGLLLYVCVEGVSPLRRDTTLATLAAVLDDPVPPPVRSGPLAPVLQALLVRDPAARPDGARLDAMLAQAESGASPHPAPPPWAQPTQTSLVRPPGPPPGPPTPGPAPTPPPAPAPAPASPTPTTAAEPYPRPRSRTPVIAAAAAVAVAVVAATALVFALREPGGGPEAGTSGSNGANGNGGGTATSSALSSPLPTPATTPPSPAPTPTSTPTPTPSEDPAERPSTPGEDGGDGLADSWVAQLASVPKSSGTAARERQARALRDKGVDNARYLDSGAYASLRAGYWMFYVPGFDDGAQAVSWCQDKGLGTRNECVGRFLSHRESDRQYLCAPATGGGVSGRCSYP